MFLLCVVFRKFFIICKASFYAKQIVAIPFAWTNLKFAEFSNKRQVLTHHNLEAAGNVRVECSSQIKSQIKKSYFFYPQ